MPGRIRPIRSSHASRGFLRREVPPAISGSVVSGSQKSGIPEAAILAPKKPGGVTPRMVKEWPLSW